MYKNTLTIATATYRDDEGIWFTLTQINHALQQLQEQNCDIASKWKFELLVADNDQDRNRSAWLKRTCDALRARYLDASQIVGTAYPRDCAIKQADSDYVLMLDSHVYITAKSLVALLSYLANHPGTDDLIQGPLIYDQDPVVPVKRKHYNDCYVPLWRDEMLGIGSRVWVCTCRNGYFAVYPEPVHVSAQSLLRFWSVEVSDQYQQDRTGTIDNCPACGRQLPYGLYYINHEQRLFELGFNQALNIPDLYAYQIPMLGLGLFCVRRESWLGFAPGMAGFAGEEGLIHGLYRRLGRQVICVRGLEWRHYFGQRPTRAQVKKYDKVRNFVLMAEYACHRTIDDIYNHFVLGKDNHLSSRLNNEEWEKIMSETANVKKPCGQCPGTAGTQQMASAAAAAIAGKQQSSIHVNLPSDMPAPARNWFSQIATEQSNSAINNFFTQILVHVPTIMDGSANRNIWIAGHYADMLAAILAYVPQRAQKLVLLPGGELAGVPLDGMEARLQKLDFVDIKHLGDEDDLVLTRFWLFQPLRNLVTDIAHHFARIYVINPEVTYIPQGSTEPVTELAAELVKLVEQHHEFTRVYWTKQAGGMAIFSRLVTDKKQPPSVWRLVPQYIAFRLWFLVRSLFTGKGYVTAAEAQRRWTQCLLCEARFGERCGECGCYLRQFPNGALGRVWYRDRDCPLKKWPKSE